MKHPLYGISYYNIQYLDKLRRHRITQMSGLPVHVVNECIINKWLSNPEHEFTIFYNSYKKLAATAHTINLRDAIYG